MDLEDKISPKASIVSDTVSSKTTDNADSNSNVPDILEICEINTLKSSDNKMDNNVDVNGKMGLDDFVVNNCDYRDCNDDSEDSSSESYPGFVKSSSASTSSSSSEEEEDNLVGLPAKKDYVVKTKGELSLADLPKVEELNISVLECELNAIGKIFAMVKEVLVIAAFKNSPPLEEDSVLFLSTGKAIGKVFEILGPVVEPYYTVRFNSAAELKEKDFVKDDTVYYAPENKDITSYVFLDELRTQKGSDASWTDNNEPPPEYLDYSDDEQEREARHKRRAKTRTVSNADEVPRKVLAVAGNKKDGFQNNMYRQSKPVSFQNQQPNFQFRNSAFTFPGSFIRNIQPRAAARANFLCNSNINVRQPGLLSMKPVLLQPPRFQVPSHPRPNGWPICEVRPQAVTFHQPNHQIPPLVNIQVQSTFINTGEGRQSLNNLASQSNLSGVAVQPSNVISYSSTFGAPSVTSGHHSRMQSRRPCDSPQLSNTTLHLNSNSSVMVARAPSVYNPGTFSIPPPAPSSALQHPSSFSASAIKTENYKGVSFRMQSKMASKQVNSLSLLQSNVNTCNTSVPPRFPVPLHQSLRIVSPPSLNSENLQGNKYSMSTETAPSQIANVSVMPSQLPSYNYSTTMFPLTTCTGHSDVLRIPNMPPPVMSKSPNFSTSVPPPLITWPSIQQPVFGLLPNNIRNMFGMPIHTPPPGSIISTNMISSPVLRGVIHATPTPPPSQFSLPAPNTVPFFDPSVPPPSV